MDVLVIEMSCDIHGDSEFPTMSFGSGIYDDMVMCLCSCLSRRIGCIGNI